jgi:2-hydroxychromene-2-carboxylate isomerase
MRILSPAKLAYLSRNLQDWCDYHGIKGFGFPSNFPLRTVLPMRVLLANDKADDRLQAILCKLISEINAIFLVCKFLLYEEYR